MDLTWFLPLSSSPILPKLSTSLHSFRQTVIISHMDCKPSGSSSHSALVHLLTPAYTKMTFLKQIILLFKIIQWLPTALGRSPNNLAYMQCHTKFSPLLPIEYNCWYFLPCDSTCIHFHHVYCSLVPEASPGGGCGDSALNVFPSHALSISLAKSAPASKWIASQLLKPQDCVKSSTKSVKELQLLFVCIPKAVTVYSSMSAYLIPSK